MFPVTVSAGVSIPFVLLAFNFEKVITWPSQAMEWLRQGALAMSIIVTTVAIVIIALAVILSQPLSSQIKAATCLAIGLIAVVIVVSILISGRGQGGGLSEESADTEASRTAGTRSQSRSSSILSG